jgi:hypothetical protein
MEDSAKKIASSLNLISIMMVVLVAIVAIHAIYNVKDNMVGDFPIPLPSYPTMRQQASNDTRTRISVNPQLYSAV